MKLIMKYISKYKGLFIINILAVVLVASAELGIPFIISRIIDDVMPVNDMTLLTRFILFLVLVAVLGAIGNIILNYCASRTSAYILKDLRNDIFAKVQTFEPTEMQDLGVSSMINRTMTDVFQILNFVSTFYRSAVLAPLMFIFSIILIVVRAPQLSTSILVVAPIIVLILVGAIRLTKVLSERQQRELDQLNLITRENLTGVRVIRAFRKSIYEQKRFENINKNFTNTSVKVFRIMVSIEPVFYFFFNVSILVLMFFGTQFIEKGSITIGQLVEFLDYQFHVMFSILTFALLFMMYPKTMVSSRRIKEILDKEPLIKKDAAAPVIAHKIASLRFEHVSFKYPDADVAMLKDINFEVKKGEVIAFVGSTGSGKSTLIQLIPRLYEATSGSIYVNDQNIAEVDIHDLRAHMGYILQKALLFQGSIRSNLLFGKNDASESDILSAIEIAQAKDFIMGKENGLDSYVSELGTNLSGGQKQRISIARAIIKRPDIYIFDDSFSALDYKTDFELRKALFKETKESIVLMVAQRLASIMQADKIIVMHHGEIIDMGKHEQLLERCQIYREIAVSQNLMEVAQ